MFRLKDKTAIVSGGSKGIGKAIALKYAEAGANVVICSRKKDNLNSAIAEAKSSGLDIVGIECNTGDISSIQNVVDQTISQFEKVDILVNNAAANPYYGPILKSEDSHWEKIWDINVKGYFNFIKACSPSMEQHKYGKIINIASIAAKTPMDGLGVYNISKAAVVMLTKVLAKEMATSNIQVNTLAPGLIKTDFSKALWEDESVYNQIIKSIPQGRMGEPEDISGMALYLASDASDFITGSMFTVDGGLTT
ncbi:MAG: short-chain dehydrogenase [Candidatus Marinimicrobia bacterium]|jgi:dehydrogenase/reductase SDR family protein 4|nr:short-chain dehydrogenase [Candidatus Neomarinimicrobiota bacterium]|tara:strand:+ start:1175 stop:1927 length:753 start_codon:yes stop_codon:yes gene_type:complete